MKKHILNLILVVLLVFSPSCSDILDKTPLDQYSDATVWSNPELASLYLNYVYNGLNHGFQSVKSTNYTDEAIYGRGASTTTLLNGTLTPDAGEGTHYVHSGYRWSQYANIQRVNKFLDKIDLVADAYPESQKATIKAQTDVLKGEALFLRAFMYHNLARTYGGLVLLETAAQLSDDFSGMTRSTFEETVNFIIDDCDAAAGLLPLKSDQELGRACKEAALALKARMLLFAASDLTAGDASDIGITSADEVVHYKNPDRTAMWTAAKNAAKAVMDLPGSTLELADFGASGGDKAVVAKNYRALTGNAATPANGEFIFARMFDLALGTRHRTNQVDGPNGYDGLYGRNGPMQRMVDEYEMEDGSNFFDHYQIETEGTTKYIKNKPEATGFDNQSPYYNREARFYALVLYDSAKYEYEPRPVSLQTRDPLGIYDRRTRITINADGSETVLYGIDTRNGPIVAGNGNYCGYLTMKWVQDGVTGSTGYNFNIWPFMRYTEVVLNYAEACWELGEYDETRKWVNFFRNRVLLPNTTATNAELRDALRHERKIELYGEELRWFDLRRWMIFKEEYTKPMNGVVITQKTDTRTTPATVTTTWELNQAMPDNKWIDAIYWMPIRTDERQKAPQLVQNPNYRQEIK
ncbi:MAG TPA: RagB/SusD family nutrient uptake outer membrane protein [Candidatus Cloacimonadota bacterium]|nr:RagB/SusD family nutrient uptake outer membrane protein [Bacteroidales bacterium]HOX75621.1 RagB/SusD family nutrient uptake outer membrane protein [Bacteroidales bacterium]HPM03405.1 RagB/SusD family nutrient uptake outer membrane protein [Candidatus Cloacimonadota bacterium]HQM67713.1 RagB/SusD family nutrient uptake outer membrane protein [Bacteroidales bacterium]